MDREDQVKQEEMAGASGTDPKETETAGTSDQEETKAETVQTEDAGAEGSAGQEEDGGAGKEPEQSKEGDSQKTEKKGFFKKKEKDPRDQKIEDLTDQLKRTMAEFDNFRKRTEKEKSTMYEMGAKDIIERMLPVVDNFERGLASIPESEKNTAFAEGMEKIYKQFQKVLEDAGVKAIEAAGQPFDPNFHNAVMHVEDENFGENIVAEELQKGYMYRDSVVRHSMVKVAN